MESSSRKPVCETCSTSGDSTDKDIHPITGCILGDTDVMRAVQDLVVRASQHTFPVLVLGETGTGKELVARLIHNLGPRRQKPFVPVDCAAVSTTLIESELFGHTKGAFTGADYVKCGLLQEADEGTLFLDEIGDLPLELQPKLLRAVQEKQIRPVGSTSYIPLHFRVIAATNRDIEAAVQSGEFRQDLYYRLNVCQIKLPPLRERRKDIPLLAERFLTKHRAGDIEPRILSGGALRRLMSYDWPGNVRELENAIERAVALSSSTILGADDFPLNIKLNDASAEFPALDGQMLPLGELERRAILGAIKKYNGDKLAAAVMLGIGKTTLYRRLIEYAKMDPMSQPF